MDKAFHKEIRRLIDKTCDDNGVPELKHKIDYDFNSSFTRRLGDAIYREGRGKIRLSGPLWPRATEDEKSEVVIHEACHIVTSYKNQHTRVQAHGEEWKQAMRNCGLEPRRTHSIDRTGLKRKSQRWAVAECPEEKKCTIGPKKFNKLKKSGGCITCRKCKLNINFHSFEEYEEG